jgi:ribosomal protein S18 acetylase RimI-like enzyme
MLDLPFSPQPLANVQSPAQVAAAMEANTVAYWASHSATPGAEMGREADRVWIRSGRPCPITNCVVWADFSPDDADRRIAETQVLYRPANLSFLWSIGPSSRPADLGRRLLAHGLRYTGDEPGMAVELHRLPEEWPQPANLAIVRVDDARSLRRWVGTYVAGFEMPAHWHDNLLAWETDPGDAERGRRLQYLGLLRGRPVATAQLLLGGGVAGLYGLATVPRARSRGIGTAMTLFAMRQALAMGYHVGVLFAAEMGRPLYCRLGFREYLVASDYASDP